MGLQRYESGSGHVTVHVPPPPTEPFQVVMPSAFTDQRALTILALNRLYWGITLSMTCGGGVIGFLIGRLWW